MVVMSDQGHVVSAYSGCYNVSHAMAGFLLQFVVNQGGEVGSPRSNPCTSFCDVSAQTIQSFATRWQYKE